MGDRGILTDEQIDSFAKKLDQAIPVPLVPDFAEVYIFKGVVILMDAFVLSRIGAPLYSLINDVAAGVENGRELEALIDRLVETAMEYVPFPVVSDELKETIFRATITLIITAMYKGRDIETQTQTPKPLTANELGKADLPMDLPMDVGDFQQLVSKVAQEMVDGGQVVSRPPRYRPDPNYHADPHGGPSPHTGPDLRENHGVVGGGLAAPLGSNKEHKEHKEPR